MDQSASTEARSVEALFARLWAVDALVWMSMHERYR